MKKTLLFAGPSSYSIDLSRYSWIVNEGPCKQSDILNHLLSDNFERIIIADGFYKSVPAPWHKEILIAIKEGVEVIGTSSLGALRAAELDKYGMIGFGKVYRYMKEELRDDSEVALIHELSTSEYRPITLAHVEVIFWIRNCLDLQLITESQAIAIIGISETTFFEKRTKQFLSRLITTKIPGIDIDSINRHWFSQKVQDLSLLLEQLNNSKSFPYPESNSEHFELPWTPYIFRQASKDICHPCHCTGVIDNANTLANFLSFALLSDPNTAENLYLQVHSDFLVYDIVRLIKDDPTRFKDNRWIFLHDFVHSFPSPASPNSVAEIFVSDDFCMMFKAYLLENQSLYTTPSEVQRVNEDYFAIERDDSTSNTAGKSYIKANDLSAFFSLGILWSQIKIHKNQENSPIQSIRYKEKLEKTLLNFILLGLQPNVFSVSIALALREFIETKALYHHSGRLLLLQKFLADPSSDKILNSWKSFILSKGPEQPHSFYLDSLSMVQARDSLKHVRQMLSTGLINLRNPAETLPFYFHDYGYLGYSNHIYRFQT